MRGVVADQDHGHVRGISRLGGRDVVSGAIGRMLTHGSGPLAITRAGIPATVASAGTSDMTTELAPIRECAPTHTPPRILAPAPMSTCPSMIGTPRVSR